MARGDFKQRVIFELVDQASAPASAIAQSLGTIVTGLKAFAGGALIQQAFGALSDVLIAGTNAASEAEQQTAKLTAALQLAGPTAQAFAENLKIQADQLQRLGIVSSEAVTGTQALLANLGVSGSQLERATQASLDLSAALGVSLETAAAQVGATVNGFTGKLGRLVPELTALSDESLRAGDGIRVLSERFGGSAAQQAQTYAASVNRLKEALQDTAEVIGGSGAGPGVAAGIQNLALAIEQANQAAAGSLLSTFFGDLKQGAVDLTATLISQGAFLAESVGLFGANAEATRSAAKASREAAAAFQTEAIATEQRANAQRAATVAQDAFVAAVEGLGVTLETSVNAEIERNNALLEQADEFYRRGVITRADFERINRAIAASEVELRASLTGTTDELGNVEGGYIAAGLAASDYETRVNATAASARAAAVAVAELGDALGNSIGLVARDPRSQGLVDAAVAAGRRPILGGTRIRLPGGGSRLVGV